jgi:indole-3-glycerol phosphate synthase
MSILDEIFAYKRSELAQRQSLQPLASVQAAARQAAPALDFLAALRQSSSRPALIAEVKQASPSRGVLTANFDPLRLARAYQRNGAAAISVLTDEHFFQGSLDTLSRIAELQPRLPLLRKDFIFDPYQVHEARAAGADAILFIAAMLEQAQLRSLHSLAQELDLTPLVEVHSLAELELALTCQPVLVGINNRDLHDFSVSLETTLTLREHVPAGIMVVAESGIHTPQDVERLDRAGVDAILVGEALVTAPDVGAAVRRLTRRVEQA